MQPTDMNEDRTRTGKRRRVMLDAESKSKLLKWCDTIGFTKYLGALACCHNNRALCANQRKTKVYELISTLGLSARVSGRSATPEEMERTVDEHLRTFVLDERRRLAYGTTYAEKNGTKDKKLSQPEQMTFNLRKMFNNFDESTSKFTPTPVVVENKPRVENPNAVHTIDALESRPVPDQILGIVKTIIKGQSRIDGKLDDITTRLRGMETTMNRTVAFIELVAAAASAFSKSYETQV